MIKLIGKLIKFVVIVAIILALLVGLLYVGSEVLDLDFCEEIVEELEDVIDDLFDGIGSDSRGEYKPEEDRLLEEVFPGYHNFYIVNTSNLPDSIAEAYEVEDKAGYAFVVRASNTYSGAPIEIYIGVHSDGTVNGVRLRNHSEPQPGVDLFEYATRFEGMNINEIGDRYDEMLISGATTSSSAVVTAITHALIATDILNGKITPDGDNATIPEPEIERGEDELLERATNLVGSSNFTKITVARGEKEFVKRLYKDENGGGYVAYLVVESQYGYPETETLVYIGADRKIVAIDKIDWRTSDANPEYGFYPPEEDVVNAFYDRLIGAGSYELHYGFISNEAELVTGATSTSKKLVESIYEAVIMVENM